MDILCDSNNVALFAGLRIEKGIYDEPFEKWGIFGETGIKLYAIDHDYFVGKVEEVPDDFDYGKYIFADGKLVRNPDYEEPPKPVEEVVEELAESMEETEGIVDTVLSDILPSHNTSISELEDMIDFLLTEILPNRV